MTANVKIEDIDDEDMSITFNVVEGDALRFYKSFKAKLEVIKVRDGVGSAEWTLEFDEATEDAPHPEHYVDFAVKMSRPKAWMLTFVLSTSVGPEMICFCMYVIMSRCAHPRMCVVF